MKQQQLQKDDLNDLLYQVIYPNLNRLVDLIGKDENKALRHEWVLEIERTWPTYSHNSKSTAAASAFIISQNLRELRDDPQLHTKLRKELFNLYRVYIDALNSCPDIRSEIITLLSELDQQIRTGIGSKYVSAKVNQVLRQNKHLIRKPQKIHNINMRTDTQTKCPACGSIVNYLNGRSCRWCSKLYCSSCHLPESHSCEMLQDYKDYHARRFRNQFRQQYSSTNDYIIDNTHDLDSFELRFRRFKLKYLIPIYNRYIGIKNYFARMHKPK